MTAIPGSARTPLPGARIAGPAAPDDVISVVVLIRPWHGGIPEDHVNALAAGARQSRPFLTHREMERAYGANPADIALIEEFALLRGLWVTTANTAMRLVVLSGTVERIARAFAVTLELYACDDAVYRGRIGSVFIPAHLHNIVTGVFGLDDRPLLEPALSPRTGTVPHPAGEIAAEERQFTLQSGRIGTAADIAAYELPEGSDGRGECIGIIAFNTTTGPETAARQYPGGDDRLTGGFSIVDLDGFFASVSLPVPRISCISVLGAGNRPGTNAATDAAVTLDVEMAGAIAPGASQALYFAPNTAAGLLFALKRAVHDPVSKPSAIVVSWSSDEDSMTWTPNLIVALEETMAEAVLLGITVCCGLPPQANFARLPAALPMVIACGAAPHTNLAQQEPRIESRCCASPHYQRHINPHGGRLLPDIGLAHGDAFHIVAGGRPQLIDPRATSIPAIYGALTVACNQNLKSRMGYITPLLYHEKAATMFISNTTAPTVPDVDALGAPRWQPGRGLGSLRTSRLIEALQDGDVPEDAASADAPLSSEGAPEQRDVMAETIRGLNRLLEKSWRVN